MQRKQKSRKKTSEVKVKYNGIDSWQKSDREEIKEELEDHHIDIVFCSTAAQEGVNLQSASTLINIDVPWIPSDLEQRIGRIARLGQEEPIVKIFNLWYPDSYEAKIIGGAITADKNDYSSGFFPSSSANYSSHNNTQYCQFEFTSVSAGIQGFDLLVTGTFTDLWVAMPNNLGGGPTGWMQGDAGWTGWADCSQTLAYGRPGTGGTGGALVGGESDGNHNAINATTGEINSSEVIHVNFGTSNTVWSTGNKTVFIRFSLSQGQSITRLAVKPYLST